MQQRKNNIPPYYHNEFAQTSQNNFQNQQKQQQTVPPQIISNMNPFNVNQPGSSFANHPFPTYQAECFGGHPIPSQNLIPNSCQQNPNLCSSTPGMQNQNYFGSLSQGLMDQFRSCINSAAPIFILPNACPNPAPTTPQLPNSILGNNMGYPMNYPPIGIPYPTSPPVCIPYALPIPIYNNIPNQDSKKEKSNNCECCPKTETIRETFKNPNIFHDFNEHKCKENRDDTTICAKKNCPSSLNLQALASQFLSIQGIISCAATRLILRKIPGSNVTTSIDETIQKAIGAIDQLTKDQLLAESRNAQQINALINIHMNGNSPTNIIPILTMIQLKVNLLKAHVEHLVNKKLMENQGIGAEGSGNLDPIVLTLKTDAELREFLAALREKECQEKVEDEMNRRRNISIPRTSIVNRLQCQTSNPCCYYNNSTLNASQTYGSFGPSPTQTYESPDPFIIQVRSPKRLNLKPHVGSPETTYEQSKDTGKDIENGCCNLIKQNSENDNRSSLSSSDPPSENIEDKRKSKGEPAVNNQSINLKNDDDGNNKEIQCSTDNSEVDNIPSKEISHEGNQECENGSKNEIVEKKISDEQAKEKNQEENLQESKTSVNENLGTENKLCDDNHQAPENDLGEENMEDEERG